MAGISFDAKWTIGTTIGLIGIAVVMMQFQSGDAKEHADLVSNNVLAIAKSYADEKWIGVYTTDEASIAFSFRDERIKRLEKDVRHSLETLNKVSTLVYEYRDLVRQFMPKADEAKQRSVTTEVRVVGLVGHMAKIENAIERLKVSQEEIREKMIPDVSSRIEAHAAHSHNLIRVTPNAGLEARQ